MPIVVNDVRAILLDIEGTTTPIEFVHDTLFNYAREKIGSFLTENIHNKVIQQMVEDLGKLHHEEESIFSEIPAWDGSITKEQMESATRYCVWLISRDSKAPPLKELEGLIWKDGYNKGELKGNVYGDVPDAFKKWKASGKSVYIYSSGSVLSQKLLFSTTQYGDMTRYIDGYFDTSIGTKTDQRSYEMISEISGIPAHNFLFLTDAPKEIYGAVSAGFHGILVKRGMERADAGDFKETISDFTEIILP
ncbi:MAG: acireductone synthase [Thermoplasmataceae archaeon]